MSLINEFLELIDTLWNVNVENIDLYYIDPGN